MIRILILASILMFTSVYSLAANYKFSGFGDIIYTIPNGETDFDVNQVELILEKHIHEYVELEIAVEYHYDEFELDIFEADFKALGHPKTHYHGHLDIESAGFIVGKFNVPFGIDYHVYNSNDRMLISSPIIVDLTHNRWNDIGIQGYLKAPGFDGIIYIVNGDDYGYGFSPNLINTAFGTKLNFSLKETISVGGSAAILASDFESSNIYAWGLDFQFNYEEVGLKAEYIGQRRSFAATDDILSNGFYGQATIDFDKYFLVGRIGGYTQDTIDFEDVLGLTGGIGYRLVPNVETRAELRIVSARDTDSHMNLQLVVGF